MTRALKVAGEMARTASAAVVAAGAEVWPHKAAVSGSS